MGGDKVLDAGAIARLDRIGGSEFVVEMIELFLENAPQRLKTARDAFETGDTPTLHRAVHSLKSTAANLGARALQATAEAAEARANEADLAAMPPLLDELDRSYDAAKEALEAERDRRNSVRGRTEE
ncbi:MAG: Hpt domain-containing protein [Longimicrobiales bacterium]